MQTLTGLFVLSILAPSLGCSGGAPSDGAADVAPLVAADVPADPSAAAEVLYLGDPPPAACAAEVGDARVRCLLSARYASDPAARDLALDLFASTGDVAGVAPAQTMDGGYRGELHLVPELPIGAYRKHLGYVRDAMRDFDEFFGALEQSATSPIRYRWRTIAFRFFRSVGRTTPSAYTEGTWEAYYNVSGSLVASAAGVRDTLFHEFFHINDWNHDGWSRALAPLVAGIASRCGTRTACLAPYTPTDTLVRGGTYYAFQPDNGPLEVEYSAELASRYYAEQRAAMKHTRLSKPPFKCGPPENRRAWDLVVNEFFGGADLVPPCAS
jgi:hypothetical protein